ncbi:Phospholipid scramblase 3 [Phytophthora citrophthora]|uniref:Phospholipid scramblase 3 n=1 Tax=Phytophthora citrophthora TaxID=4793 RepID=A0AAD9GK94_9STRA|nr:Phospholipid scramblase 3 [Phytophthora citrophthora]
MKYSSGGYELIQKNLGELEGVVVRQDTQVAEVVAQAVGISWEASNKYVIHRLPANKKVKNDPNDPSGWSPTGPELKALEPFMRAQEESWFLSRIVLQYLGCGNLRPLKMHLTIAGETGDVYVIDRPYKCGGALCCPLEMKLSGMSGNSEVKRIGRVREDFSPYLGRCCSACCLATSYTDIERALPDGTYEKRYSLRINQACCGRVNNCCAPSCCRNDAVYDILDPDGAVVANLQVSFGTGECLKALCRAGGGFTNYVLQFPRDSTAQDRALLLAALFHLDYALFEKQ